MSGWIKLHRSLKDWEWYDDHNATRLLIHLLLTVNVEDKKWKNEDIKAGSMVISYDSLSKSVGLSVQKCRTALDKLESSGEITRRSTNKYQVVSLCKWGKLQFKEKKQQATQQPNNNQITTTKEYKELKKEYIGIFEEWIEYRKNIKKPINNDNTIKQLIKKFQQHTVATCEFVVRASIENQWQGLFWDKAPKELTLREISKITAHVILQDPKMLQEKLNEGYTKEQIENYAK